MSQRAAAEVTTFRPDERVSETVIAAVAAVTDADPLEMDPLYEAIDPDALDRLFRPSAGSASPHLEFSFAGCRVEVRGEGTVTVTPAAASGDRSSEREERSPALVPGHE